MRRYRERFRLGLLEEGRFRSRSWIVATGPNAAEAMSRLEVIADTFLSMNAPVQGAIPAWIAGRGQIQEQILDRGDWSKCSRGDEQAGGDRRYVLVDECAGTGSDSGLDCWKRADSGADLGSWRLVQMQPRR